MGSGMALIFPVPRKRCRFWEGAGGPSCSGGHTPTHPRPCNQAAAAATRRVFEPGATRIYLTKYPPDCVLFFWFFLLFLVFFSPPTVGEARVFSSPRKRAVAVVVGASTSFPRNAAHRGMNEKDPRACTFRVIIKRTKRVIEKRT